MMLLSLSSISAKEIDPARVYVKKGNIIYVSNNNVQKRLTNKGIDRAPVLSPDGANVAFIRKSNEDAYDPIGGRNDARNLKADQIWTIDIAGKNERMLVRDRNSEVSNNKDWKGEDVIGLIPDASLQFSPNGETIYFLTQAWVISNALHAVSVDGSSERFITDANSLKVLTRGKYIGDLVISQHRYFLTGGSYDWYYLVTPKGELVGPLGDDLKNVNWGVLSGE